MTVQEVPTADDAIAGVTSVSATRIGLISDDHNATDDGSDLPPEVLTALDGVDLIIHLGHMGFRELLARGVLDRLEKVAPVLGVRDYSTDSDGNLFITPSDGERIAGLARIIEAAGVRIGAIHYLSRPPGPEIPSPPGGVPELKGIDLPGVLAEKFGGPVDVVATAGTHRAVAVSAEGVLIVNPGSPTYPKGPGRVAGRRALGTVGILDVSDGVTVFETIELSLLSEASDGSDGPAA
ncbi:MAG: metallophosphoesterase family protein [Acidimicrobiales bacterium]